MALAILSGCVIDANHVRTTLKKVCAEDVPLQFSRESAELSAATVVVEDVGATVDDPDARASLATAVLEAITVVDDFSFVSSVGIDVIAPGSPLPDVRVAEVAALTGESPMTAPGDPSINLVDYLTSDTLQVRVELVGPAPAPSFGVLMDACLDVEGIEIEDDDF